MGKHTVSLADRYDLTKSRVLLNDSQALVRLMLMQSERDRTAGLHTAGYVSGYRGSPLGAVDMQMMRAEAVLRERDVVFEAGINEDLAATAIWGSQQAGLRGDGTHDGVFGLWYGKGPGVDRSGDAFRHANMAGTAVHGGVVMALGDDHTGESSTTCHQSDMAAMDAYAPVLSPAGVQEILDYGLYGFALSRFSGLWAGLKLMKDTVEVTAVVDGRSDRLTFVTPEFEMPEGGLNIRLGDHWVAQEKRLVEYKRFAAEAFARANRIDKRVHGAGDAKIGVLAAGKNWLDVVTALDLLGIDDGTAKAMGLSTYKLAQTFPIDRASLREWAQGLDLLVVIEEKRKLIEGQIKEALFDMGGAMRIHGYQKSGTRTVLFPQDYSLDPVQVAAALGDILIEEGRSSEALAATHERVRAALVADNAPESASRLPYFCSGCPHSTSTVVPEGSRAYAGIGCHTMALWMDRETSSYTHMGAEGAQWIGESKFSKTGHVFQNMGDGTYNHSGLMAIRAALASDANITFKLLYNDAVALTGGQQIDGHLTADRMARELVATGVRHVAVVFDEKEEPRREDYPKEVSWQPRAELTAVQKRLRETEGVTALLYIQTCAAEKRRRRKRGTLDDPDRRVIINTEVCEGCGDCGVQSNCVSIVPVETELGAKRAIDHSSCNKDYTCLKGFCPAFAVVTGGELRKPETAEIDLGDISEPLIQGIAGTHNIVITGIGGTGVVTIGAVVAMAAHLDGKGVGMMEMAGLAQKGGAVHIHCRLADAPDGIAAIRVSAGEADCIIGGDLVVTAGGKTLGLMEAGRTQAVVNLHEVMTGAFTRDAGFRLPSAQLKASLTARLQNGLTTIDSTELARRTLGDAIYSNMILLGLAWQRGLVPLSGAALRQAIELNGASAKENVRAFEIGRWAVARPGAADRLLSSGVTRKPLTPEERISFRETHLTEYQSRRLARRFRQMVDRFEEPEIREAVALGYHKLLAYKDEYEVARLLQNTRSDADALVVSAYDLEYHLAPPVLSRMGPDGRPVKRAYGRLLERTFPVLARFKILRGTPFDPFGYTDERKAERRLIKDFEADVDLIQSCPSASPTAVRDLLAWPLTVRGFGPVKEAAIRKAEAERLRCREALQSGTDAPPVRKSA